MGTISLIIAFLALLYLNIILLIQETFIGKGFLQIVGIGLVCSVIGMITKEKVGNMHCGHVVYIFYATVFYIWIYVRLDDKLWTIKCVKGRM